MRKTSPEAWMFLVFIICIVVAPILVGLAILKIYRTFRPLEEISSTNTFVAIHEANKDGFFKILIIGWCVCGPLFYYIYTT